ncbi:MAG TPA: hypothetical protein PKK61_04195 [Defluviitaleaceae bacterium]|nr:hypothetical protein [Defluviitaleaceae bacterium]
MTLKEKIIAFNQGIEKDLIQLKEKFEPGLAYALQEKAAANEIISEMQKRTENLEEVLKIQGYSGNWNCNPYMYGMYNGLELALATIENRMANYKEKPSEWLDDRKIDPEICQVEPEISHTAPHNNPKQ